MICTTILGFGHDIDVAHVNAFFIRDQITRLTLDLISGEILYEEVCLPLEADVHVGLREELLTRVFKLESWSSAYALFQSMIPAAWGRKIEPSILDGIRIGWAFFSASRRVKHEEAEEEG